MNERMIDLNSLDKYGQNLITYSNYVNDSMNKIAAGFNNLYSERIIQGRRAKVFIDVYNEMDVSRKNIVDKLYEVKQFVDTVKYSMEHLDKYQARRLQRAIEEMGFKKSSSGENKSKVSDIKENLSKTLIGQKLNYLRNDNTDYIPPEKIDEEYEKYKKYRLTGSRTMRKEEFIIKHSNMSEVEKNYRMQILIDKEFRNANGRAWNYISSNETAENYLTKLQNESNFNTDSPLLGHNQSTSVDKLYKETLGYREMYSRDTNGNVGLTIKETIKVDGQEYMLKVDTDRVPTMKEWTQERINFISNIATPTSKISDCKTEYTFFNLDLERATQEYNKTNI